MKVFFKNLYVLKIIFIIFFLSCAKNLSAADGLVVGSEICKEITRSLNSRQNPVTNIVRLVRKLKNIN